MGKRGYVMLQGRQGRVQWCGLRGSSSSLRGMMRDGL